MDGKKKERKLKHPIMMMWSKQLKINVKLIYGIHIFIQEFVFYISGGRV